MEIKPLYTGFRSTNIWKAFILNSIASSIIIFVAIYLKTSLDNYTDDNGNKVEIKTTWKSIIITMCVTFIATFITYSLLWLTLGFGQGMIAVG